MAERDDRKRQMDCATHNRTFQVKRRLNFTARTPYAVRQAHKSIVYKEILAPTKHIVNLFSKKMIQSAIRDSAIRDSPYLSHAGPQPNKTTGTMQIASGKLAMPLKSSITNHPSSMHVVNSPPRR
ncbi:MAG TPA: hypothetical protein VLI39_20215 [Sedimentisphaerales bacterium]|nr:hypothetical protein [Sedimentisphaerales bacterium]